MAACTQGGTAARGIISADGGEPRTGHTKSRPAWIFSLPQEAPLERPPCAVEQPHTSPLVARCTVTRQHCWRPTVSL